MFYMAITKWAGHEKRGLGQPGVWCLEGKAQRRLQFEDLSDGKPHTPHHYTAGPVQGPGLQ